MSLYSFPPARLCRRSFDRRRSSGRRTFSTDLFFRGHAPEQSLIPTRRGDGTLPTQRISRGRDRILATQRIPRGRDLIFSTQRIPRWGDPIGGGLRIVSGEHVRIVSGEHGEIIGGRCVRKWRFSKKETAFADPQKFQA